MFKGLTGLQDDKRQSSVDGRNEYERSKAVVAAIFREWHGSALTAAVYRSDELSDCCVSWLISQDRSDREGGWMLFDAHDYVFPQA